MRVCYAGAKNAQRKPTEVASRVRAACMSLERVVCGAGWAMCSCEAVRVGMARGCREAKNACRTRAFAAVEAASPPRPRARGNPLCVCADHLQGRLAHRHHSVC